MSKLFSVGCLLTGFMFVAVAANAATVTQTHADAYPVSTTNWAATLAFPQFDPSLGTLTSVTVSLAGEVSGQAAAESRDAEPADVTLDLGANIVLNYPSSSGSLINVLPVVATTQTLAVSDGTLDFSGPSGFMTGLVTATDSDTTLLTSAADLSLFTGTGSVILPVSGSGASNGAGAGNLTTQFDTDAGAEVEVTYTFESVPEPVSAALLLIGGLSLFGIRRNRRKND